MGTNFCRSRALRICIFLTHHNIIEKKETQQHATPNIILDYVYVLECSISLSSRYCTYNGILFMCWVQLQGLVSIIVCNIMYNVFSLR